MDMGRDTLNGSWKKLQASALSTEFKGQKKIKRKGWYFAITDCVLKKGNIDNASPVCEKVWNDTEATGFKDEIPKLDFITCCSTLAYATSRNYSLDKPQLMC